METLTFGWQTKRFDPVEGVVEGYGAVFDNIDLGADVIQPGAFADTIKQHASNETMPAMLYQHNIQEPIGEWEDMREDSKGLFMRGKLWVSEEDGRFPLERSKQAFNMLKSKGMRGLSIGFRVNSGGSETKGGIRFLKSLSLIETSPVTVPMNPKAQTTLVKGESYDVIPTERQLESALRDIGLSKAQSRAFISKGYGALRDRWDACDEMEQSRDDSDIQIALTQALANMKESS